MNAQYDALQIKHKQTKNKLVAQEEQISFLQGQVDSLANALSGMEAELDHQQQYSWRESLRFINPVPERCDENTDSIVVNIVRDIMGVPLAEQDIARSHRVERPSLYCKPRPIIAKFVTHKVKEKIYQSRERIAMAGEQGRGFYVNEDLTKTRFDTFRYSRKLLKDHLINDTWTKDGNVFIKDFKAKVHVFTKLETLRDFSLNLRKNPPTPYAKVLKK